MGGLCQLRGRKCIRAGRQHRCRAVEVCQCPLRVIATCRREWNAVYRLMGRQRLCLRPARWRPVEAGSSVQPPRPEDASPRPQPQGVQASDNAVRRGAPRFAGIIWQLTPDLGQRLPVSRATRNSNENPIATMPFARIPRQVAAQGNIRVSNNGMNLLATIVPLARVPDPVGRQSTAPNFSRLGFPLIPLQEFFSLE